MTAVDLHALARRLGALLPQRGKGQLADDPGVVQALAARLEWTCLMAGLPACDAVIIAHSLVAFLHGWHRTWDGQEATAVLLMPYGVALTDEAIAQLLHWTLLEDREEEA